MERPVTEGIKTKRGSILRTTSGKNEKPRARDRGITGQIGATFARIGDRLARERKGDSAAQAALSPIYLLADLLYIAPQLVYLLVLVAVFIALLPIWIVYYVWVFFSN